MKTKEQALTEIQAINKLDKGMASAYFTVGSDNDAVQKVCVDIQFDYDSSEYYFRATYAQFTSIPTLEREKIAKKTFESANDALTYIVVRANQINNFFNTLQQI